MSLLLLLAACADTAGGPASDADGPNAAGPAPEGGPSYPPDDLVLRVEHTGGFVTPAMLVGRLPVISVYGDGRVITQGPQVLSYPPPALPSLVVRQLDAAGVDALIARARAAGVGGPDGVAEDEFGRPPIADANSTRFTVLTDVLEVYALDLDDSTGLTTAQVRARAKLRALLADLTDVDGPDRLYEPTAVAAISTPWTAADGDADGGAVGGDAPEVAWPGPALPGESIGPETGCVTATGAAATKVLAAAAKATAITPWRSGGRRWTVALRPLLPDEAGCADLRDR